MPDPLIEHDDAATPLTPAEREGLIPAYITHRHELNEAEQAGVLTADRWTFERRRQILDERFFLGLHKRMFGQVWRWAGRFRTTERNIGVPAYRIEVDLAQLLDDARYWIDHRAYPPDEIAARFHHRLVQIHCFPNGNGRHARLVADALLASLDQPRFSWGRNNFVSATETRSAYVEALRAADAHDFALLLAFVRS
jgi:Fic-DOC domain mobile mystery protein B